MYAQQLEAQNEQQGTTQNYQPSVGKLSVNDAYSQLADHTVQTATRNEQVLQENLSSEVIAKWQSAGKQIFGEMSNTQWNGLLADSILGKSTKLESMLETELNSAETMLQEAEAGGNAALHQQAQAQISILREVQTQILEAKGRWAKAENGVNQEDGGAPEDVPDGGLTEAPNNGTIGDKEGAPAEGKEDYVAEHSSKVNLMNIGDYIAGNKSFDDVVNDYAKLYAERVNSNLKWQWDEDISGGDNLTRVQKAKIKETAVKSGYIPNIKISKADEKSYADFKGAGVVKEIYTLPEDMWYLTDVAQFKWLDEQIGGHMADYTWHHSEIPGEMQLVPYGIHNITFHNGGRTSEMWADAPR